MGKQKMTPIGIACILLVLLVVAFMVRGSLREPEKIVLPPEPSTTEPSGPTVDNEAVDRVEVRPDTVQSAIEVLARPRVYTRTITVERYWSGGSGVSVITADYRALEGVNCIYVETEPDEAGYVERYWVSVSSGLLAAAERECDGAVVYRMAALTVSYDGVDAEDFTLPNGTVLYEPAVAATKEISEND